VRCFDAATSAAMVAEIDLAHKEGDTLGGVVEVVVEGLPPGLGSYTHWDKRLDGRLAQALMGIQAIKGVEIGDGFELARTRGSLAHDEIVPTEDGIRRLSGRAGGTEGGMPTGEILRVRAAMKPIATVPRALRTIDVETGEEARAHHQRSDVCAVPAAGIVAEAMVALVVADSLVEKFGGDSVEEIDLAHKEGDTLGGVVEVVVEGLPPGLGSHTHWDKRLDGRLAQALMGIQAIKGVEIGDGFELARTRGSLAHDEIVPTEDGIRRLSGRAGGTEGGMTTGEILRVRAAMKPIATVPRALRTVDVETGEEARAHHQRSDVCAVPAAGIVAEAMVALVVADAILEKFAGDAVEETRRNVEGYLANLRHR
ncbi:MAG: chorismate synthase, partial [Aeromicrobium sp.]